MGAEYEKVEVVEAKISEWLKGRFLKERLLFGEMAELMIESLKPLGEYRRDTAEAHDTGHHRVLVVVPFIPMGAKNSKEMVNESGGIPSWRHQCQAIGIRR